MSDLNLKEKKILFIAPIFYDYHKIIEKGMLDLGAEVYFYPERNYGLKFSIVNNFFKNSIEQFQAKHYLKIFNKTSYIDFDYLLVIKGFKMSIEFLDMFRESNPKATLIMCQWDSHINNPFSHLIKKFDLSFSFERKDIEVYKTLKYLPNFYLDDIFSPEVEEQKRIIKNDVFFVASYLPERYNILVNLNEYCENRGLKLKGVLYISFKTYIKEFLTGNRMKLKYFIFSPLKRHEYLKLWAQSKAILDISSIKQTGLSQRCIETIEGGKKLITNNSQLEKEFFYSDEQILILNNENFDHIAQFLEKKDTLNKTKYTLLNWLSTVFEPK
ncbi:hypothetical protein LPB87_04575 [Flavobacterium sp. EDS]|uniref:hypothetical protein n=1 Tax=Flavobacterium sp. EDS TaxID=2897328 RepID=UPI001E581CD6|nr:hypothetical protein [Flavobacterium sp. EDS]MCD0473666.1 hypothetical protein [Flavobacterium sp. EDS]